MEVFLAYAAALVASSIYVYRYGGLAGRLSIVGLWIAVPASQAASMFVRPEEALIRTLFVIDTASFLWGTWIALHTSRRWPIVVAGLQLDIAANEIAVLVSPAYLAKFFYAVSTVWAVPILAAMVVGTMLDRRRERFL